MTRAVKTGSVIIGGGNPVVLQSMAAVKTADIAATAATCQRLADAGAGLVRVAVDTPKDAEALKEIRKRTNANLSVDLQENYKLAELVAPFVDKIRYNPGHLHHLEPDTPWQQKVDYLVKVAEDNDCALRIGVNCGSLDKRIGDVNQLANRQNLPLASAIEHTDFIESTGFRRFCVSIKSSDPLTVIEINEQFAVLRPDVPLHLGVTEAGMPPEGIMKSRAAMEPLLAKGIGDTLRVSLTVPNERKAEEIEAGKLILANVAKGGATPLLAPRSPLNLISCPSCSRVENSRFVELAERVRDALLPFQDRKLTIAVMGCRVNGPGETDNADFGLWCGANAVNLKKGEVLLGSYSYEEITAKLLEAVSGS
jgi:(E)-4-hydroxy-3-methylbut-2-enyl-diphosphate synthase